MLATRGDGASRTPTGGHPTLLSRQLPAPIGWRLQKRKVQESNLRKP
jgi:hypothetical protein